MADNNFIDAATKRMERKGTIGSFKAAAKQADKPTMSFAKETMKSSTSSPAMKKKANFAINVNK